ncbi:MAG: helix-turn-helix transcriptional regulator [Spirochaetaceae bacterium]|jgi:AraC-like DNA-binding protein|nr:helix-turn-helix transcriptional regulator [Spirochaetaceae bacterium]
MREIQWTHIGDKSQQQIHRMKVGQGYRFPSHKHSNFHEVVILLEGDLIHKLQDDMVSQKESSLLFIPSGSSHSLQSSGALFLNIILPLDWLYRGGIELPNLKHLIVLEPEELRYISSLYDRYSISSDENLSHIVYFRLVLVLSELILRRAIHMDGHRDQDSPGWYLKARSRLASGEWQPESVAQLALLCNVTMEHLSRRWKEISGDSPLHYLQDLKLERAARLLGISNGTIDVIAQQVGYESEAYFYRKFKEKFGISPHQYRKQNRRYT